MRAPADPVLVKRLSVFASAASLFSIAVGLSGLAGWFFHISRLTTWGIAPVRMVANTAACFVLLGVSLWLRRKNGTHPCSWTRNFAANASSATAGLVGWLSLMEHLFGRNLRIDQLLVIVSPADHAAGVRPGLMSWITASDFLLLGIALLLLDRKTKRDDWPAQFLSLAAVLGTMFGFFALILSTGTYPTTMAWPTTVSFFVLTFGLIGSRAPWALGGLLVSRSTGARLLRKAVPASLLVLSIFGYSISKPMLTQSNFNWIEVSLLALLSSVILAGFVVWMASIVERCDSQRRKMEQALNLGKEEMGRLLNQAEEPQAEASLRRKAEAGFVMAVFLTVLLGSLSWHLSRIAAEDANWVTHTGEVMTELESALRHLVDVETGALGFALTGAQPFLGPYETGKNALSQNLQALGILEADNRDQERRLDVLVKQAKARIEAAKGLVLLREKAGKMPTELPLEPGKRIVDASRATVEEMEIEETRLLAQRRRRAHAAQRATVGFIALGSILGVVFLSVEGFTVSREIGVSARSRTQVNALNADLERRVAQRTADLGESEGRLAGVIQSAMDAILTVDEEQKIVLFNGAAERMFRCPAAEAMGQPITRFIPQRFHAAHTGHIHKFAETGVTNRAMGPKNVLWALRADGQEFQIEASISQVVTGGKKLFTVILRDVTERVQAEAAREHLAAVVDSSDDAIISKDMDGIINGWNRGAEKIFGYTAAEVLGEPMLMLFPPDRVNEEPGILARIRRGESVEHFETVRVRKDGRNIDVSVTISPVRDRSGAIVGASKIARDITERKRDENRLAEQAEELSCQSEELLRSQQALETQTLMLQSVLDSMAEGLVAADAQGKFLLWNPAATKIVGMGARDVPPGEWNTHYGVYMPDMVTPFPIEQNPLTRAIQGEVSTAEMFLRNPEIEEGVWIEISGSPLKDKNGIVRGGVAAFRDITDRKRAQTELARKAEELARSNADLEQFAYVASHDLQEPLRMVTAYTELLAERYRGKLDETADKFIGYATDGALRMQVLIHDLLAFSRVGRKEEGHAMVDCNGVMEDVKKTLASAIQESGAVITSAGLPAVFGNRTQMIQLFQNLIGNAIKFRGKQPPVISVMAEKKDRSWIFAVSDNGIGIAPEYAENIFVIFQRLHARNEYAGNGIGLAICKKIVERYGGKIWVESQPGAGATFRFAIPVSVPEKAQATHA
ncbi:MAG: PAS domain S-box protein [Candidatus Sulfotelmatobacter sp.]